MSKYVFLTILIAASLMLNVYLLVSPGKAPKQTAVNVVKCETSPRAVAPPEPQLTECKKQLGDEISLMTLGMIVAGLAARRAESAETEPGPDAGTGKDADAGDDGGRIESGATLCTIAQRILSGEWRGKGPEILSSVKKSLGDPDEQEKNLKNEVKRFSETLSLDDKDRRLFEERFRDLRRTREKSIYDALSAEKTDYQALIGEVRGLFGDTDGLAGELFGTEAKIKLAGAEREGRLTVLAILASIAGTPWEDAARGF
jgi:hypothetical protein